jgi:hypothetical protein
VEQWSRLDCSVLQFLLEGHCCLSPSEDENVSLTWIHSLCLQLTTHSLVLVPQVSFNRLLREESVQGIDLQIEGDPLTV